MGEERKFWNSFLHKKTRLIIEDKPRIRETNFCYLPFDFPFVISLDTSFESYTATDPSPKNIKGDDVAQQNLTVFPSDDLQTVRELFHTNCSFFL